MVTRNSIEDKTYNLGLFFGPGLPLTLGVPSGANAVVEVLFTPFFFTPSVGGGIDEVGAGVPLAVGVSFADSKGLSPSLVAAAVSAFASADKKSFDEESSLLSFLTSAAANFLSFSGDSFKVTRRVGLISCPSFDFRLAVAAVGNLDVVDAIVKRFDENAVGWDERQTCSLWWKAASCAGT
jgi:hypothetical protein